MPLKKKIKLRNAFLDKKLIVFDMDGTLTPSKAPIDNEMIKLLSRLLNTKSVAVIGGGKYGQFKQQFVRRLPRGDNRLKRLFLFPTSATAFYRFDRKDWYCVYSHKLSPIERKKIKKAFAKTFTVTNYKHPSRTYGSVIEDRGTQVTFSALGQDVVAKLGKRGLSLKEKWNKYSDIRPRLMKVLRIFLPQFEIRKGGLTAIDVTRKGIDKAYGIRQIEKQLKIKVREMLFVGDAIYPGGNDYAIVKTGIDYIKVKNPKETKKIIKRLI